MKNNVVQPFAEIANDVTTWDGSYVGDGSVSMRKLPSGLRAGLLRAQIAPLWCVLEPSAEESRCYTDGYGQKSSDGGATGSGFNQPRGAINRTDADLQFYFRS